MKLWNQISEKLKCKPFNLFKKLYKEFLLNVLTLIKINPALH